MRKAEENQAKSQDIGLDPLCYTVPEAAKLLRISRNSAYDAVRSGELPSVTFGRRRLIPKAALERKLMNWQQEKGDLA